MTAVN